MMQPGGPAELNLQGLLREMVARGASDLHITAGQPPKLRMVGEPMPV